MRSVGDGLVVFIIGRTPTAAKEVPELPIPYKFELDDIEGLWVDQVKNLVQCVLYGKGKLKEFRRLW